MYQSITGPGIAATINGEIKKPWYAGAMAIKRRPGADRRVMSISELNERPGAAAYIDNNMPFIESYGWLFADIIIAEY